MPKRTFDQMGRETDRRTGKLLNTAEPSKALCEDPLVELWNLYESVMPKPDLGMPEPSSYAGPNQGKEKHPVAQQKDDINVKIKQGVKPEDAHQEVHGEVDTSDIQSKGKLAATLGRIQDDGLVSGVKLEPEKGSILSRDAEVEAKLDQVTDDDLKTPMNQQVPDRDQTPQDQVAEDTEIDYNDDVAYLQTFGRA